jgi:hypothetical protein
MNLNVASQLSLPSGACPALRESMKGADSGSLKISSHWIKDDIRDLWYFPDHRDFRSLDISNGNLHHSPTNEEFGPEIRVH